MSFSPKTFTQETKWLLGLKQDLKLRLSSTLSFTEQETQKLEVSLEEAQETAQILNNDFYEIHLLLKVYENALVEHLGEAISQDLTDEDLELDLNMLH
jgi:hypothetical protein